MINHKKLVSYLSLFFLFLGHFSFSNAMVFVEEDLTTQDEAKVETEILRLQKYFFDNTKSYLEKIAGKFEEATSYEETGNSEINFSLDEEYFGQANLNISFNEYNVKKSGFDSEVSTNISGNIDYSPAYYGSGMELDFDSFFSMISKKGEIYAMLKDFNFEVNNESVSKILSTLKEDFGTGGEYIKFPSNENTQLMYEILENFSINTMINRGEAIFEKPFLETYKKSGNKYYLRPTKHICDTYFELEGIFSFGNPRYTPNSCNDIIYKGLLEEFYRLGDFYLIMGEDENIFGYHMEEDTDDTVVDFTVTYDENEIFEMNINIVPDQERFPNEGFYLEYKKNDLIKSKLYAENGDITFNLDAELSENNKITKLDLDINFDEDFVGNLKLENKKINGFFILKEMGYDYDTRNYVLKNIYGAKISGTTNDEDKLENLNIKSVGVDMETKTPFFIAIGNYDSGDFAVSLKIDDGGESYEFSGKGKIEENKLKNLNTNFVCIDTETETLFTAIGNYDSGDFAVSLEIDDGFESLEFSGEGEIEEKYFKMDGYFSYKTIWYDDESSYDGIFNLEFDFTQNKVNSTIVFKLNENLKEMINLFISNKGQREYENVEINAPEDYRELNTNELEESLNNLGF